MNPHAAIGECFRLTKFQHAALKKLGIETIEDMLYHFPARYGEVAVTKRIAELQKGETVMVYGRIEKLRASKGFKTKITMAEGVLVDDTGSIACVWFNQPYLAKMIPDNSLVRAEGKISEKRKSGGGLYISNPKIEVVKEVPLSASESLFGAGDTASRLHPVYPESRGVSSHWLYHTIQKIIKNGTLAQIEDPIPPDILKKYSLPSLATGLIWIHAPKREEDARAARKRFAFEEIFLIQIQKQQERWAWGKEPSFAITDAEKQSAAFIKRLPFAPTTAQRRAIAAINADFAKGRPMARLLEGDVGSGKTAVAAATAYAIMGAKLQVAYLCPTEILATQQFENFISFFAHLNITIGLITSSGCRKFPSKVNPHAATDISRAQLLKWVANGEIAALVGTHALIQKAVRFKHLAYAIIDEQHRFGVNQRKKLIKKEKRVPHLLSMTATPIPRTLALTMFGDLDLTLLDEMPAGRKPIITTIVLPHERHEVYAHIRQEIARGRQVYVICPRIAEPDPTQEITVQAKSAQAEAARLKKDIFPEYEIAVVHSKLKPTDKEKVMEHFKNGKTHILVSTSVVEVGVNVPNATTIVIEGAERFGLAQLHQLRGRVLRSTHQAHCFVFAESAGEKTIARLKALTGAKNGFELAEYDLAQRGAGELSGLRQWGVSDVAMEALKNIKMVEAARTEAARLVGEDATCAAYPALARELARRARHNAEVHFE